MALQDFLDSEYLRKFKNDKANAIYRKKIMITDIRMTEEFHLYNAKDDNQAAAYASSIWMKDDKEVSRFFFIHSRNIICTEDPERGGYKLLSGAISYKALNLIYANQTDQLHRPRKIIKNTITHPLKVFVVPYKTREELMRSCVERYELKTWAKAEYIDASFAPRDEIAINIAYEKMISEPNYNETVLVEQDNKRLMVTGNAEIYFARMRYLNETRDEEKRIRVTIPKKSKDTSVTNDFIY